jgi:hypothetical protein
MNINWNWANRSIRAINSLAAQWKVDLSTLDLEKEIADENWHQYSQYASECREVYQGEVPVFQSYSQTVSSFLFDQAFEPQNDDQFWVNMALLFGGPE